VTFWIPWAVNAVVASVLLFFFLWGLADDSVSSFNIGLWLLMLGVAAVVLGGSLALKAADRVKLAKALVMVFAIPGVVLGLFFAVIVLVPGRWN